MKYLTIIPLVLALAACSTLPAEAGKSDVGQNVRGGFFASYTGNHGNASGSTKIKGDVGTTAVDLTVEGGAPFVMIFDGTINADTSTTNSGSTTATQTPSNTQNPSTSVPVNVTPGSGAGQ